MKHYRIVLTNGKEIIEKRIVSSIEKWDRLNEIAYNTFGGDWKWFALLDSTEIPQDDVIVESDGKNIRLPGGGSF